MKNKLIKIINSLSGSLITIGLEDELVKIAEKNTNILNFDELNYYSKKGSGKGSKKNKKISIKKIRKIYKKKSVDYIICNYEQIEKFMNTFVKDSVYINKGKLYFYGDFDEKVIIKKYKRYNIKIDILDFKGKKIIEIDNSLSKNNFVKDLLYYIYDAIVNAIDMIGNILMG